jgi:GNAT superfamily N-acetyltransferase
MPKLEVRRTYLEMTDPRALLPVPSPDPRTTRVEPVLGCPPSFLRYLYAEVGRRYHWADRLRWSDDELRARVANPDVSVHLLSVAGAPAGYFELERHADDSVEIAYLGLLPEFLGRGLGKHLVSEAARTAWALEPRRVWLHTCTLDDAAALPNYLARGFRAYRTESYETDVSPAPSLQTLTAAAGGEGVRSAACVDPPGDS